MEDIGVEVPGTHKVHLCCSYFLNNAVMRPLSSLRTEGILSNKIRRRFACTYLVRTQSSALCVIAEPFSRSQNYNLLQGTALVLCTLPDPSLGAIFYGGSILSRGRCSGQGLPDWEAYAYIFFIILQIGRDLSVIDRARLELEQYRLPRRTISLLFIIICNKLGQDLGRQIPLFTLSRKYRRRPTVYSLLYLLLLYYPHCLLNVLVREVGRYLYIPLVSFTITPIGILTSGGSSVG